ncbi:phosphatidylserine decarboxylase [Bacteriovorax sp. Seq25_V]|uniref:phosphatidylserine decarboxylase n=1 Tax=Bacteriovorax sp. Seq25_V TaxID=1201288 RepID=UPI00038A0D69|nr:phosphatidylserine decarboxylase [Bacteriovorax sp. Seq25_V]EQC44815.1 phosphatidylserine decarboxylase [Bacteriovorax sp. Seq25_V]
MKIQYFSRPNGQVETEKVYGDSGVKWLYESLGGKILSPLLATAPISVIYGMMQSSSSSKNKIPEFIKNFDIKMEDYIPEKGRPESDPYSSFNKFFIRQFREGKREFIQTPNEMPAFCEARYFGYDSIRDEDTIPVKGKFLNAKELLANEKWTSTFNDGPLLLARLCPVDYHRFHYPDNGKVIDYYKVSGKYHSVNPIALKKKNDIFSTNIREVTILETENFGKLAYVEVGAICVGRIVQSTDLKDFKRGQEKGYFLFGGSTVIVIGEKGKWAPSTDILENTKKGMETYLHIGTQAGLKL